MLGVTILAVAKVIIAVMVGAYTAKTIPFRDSTIRDFSFLISNVLLPCLTVANTAKSVTIDVLVRCSVLVFFAVLLIGIGVGTALIMSATLFRTPKNKAGIPPELQKDVRLELQYDASTAGPAASKKGTPYVAVVMSEDLRARGVTGADVVPLLDVPSPEMEAQPGYFWGSIVGCSIQNTVTLPLSLLQSLSESVAWVRFDQGSAYIFVFRVACTLYLWMCGPLFVEAAQRRSEKLRQIREIVTQHKRRMQQCDAFTQTEVKANSTFSPVAHNGAVADFPSHSATADSAAGTSHTDYPLPHVSVTTVPTTGSGGSFAGSTSSHVSVAHQSSQVDFGSPSTARVPKFFAPTEDLCGQQAYDWTRAGLLRPVYAGDMETAAKQGGRLAAAVKEVKSVCIHLLKNIPFVAVIVSIVIGITPPLRALFFDGGVLEVLMDSVTMISHGCVPSSLLLLGVNLAGSTGSQAKEDPNATRQLRHSEQNTDFPLYAQDLELIGEDTTLATRYNAAHAELASEDDSNADFDQYATFSLQDLIQRNADAREREAAELEAQRQLMNTDAVVVSTGTSTRAGVRRGGGGGGSGIAADEVLEAPPPPGLLARVQSALNVEGVRKMFIWGTIAIRLMILPAISFVVLVGLVKAVPTLFGPSGEPDKTLILVLFLELAAPTAINSALLFNQRQYMTYPWAKMLFFQYVLCSFSLVLWATVGLATVDAL